MPIDDEQTFVIGVIQDMSKIRNTNGNWWEPTGANLQLAIDDLAESGSVWCGSDITLAQPINMKPYVDVDFLRNKVTLNSDIEFAHCESCVYSSIRNAHVYLDPDQTASPIHLYNSSSAQWRDKVRYNTFENISFHNTSWWEPGVGWSVHKYSAIHLEIKASNMLWNIFRNIHAFGAGAGIKLEVKQYEGWGNGNIFEHCWIDQFVTMIWFDVIETAKNGFNRNLFLDIKGQSAAYSDYGVRDISHSGNHFSHCLCWDWHVSSGLQPYDWIVRSDARDTCIIGQGMQEILDEGTNTNVLNY